MELGVGVGGVGGRGRGRWMLSVWYGDKQRTRGSLRTTSLRLGGGGASCCVVGSMEVTGIRGGVDPKSRQTPQLSPQTAAAVYDPPNPLPDLF